MSILKAACPTCAAPIEFQKGSTIVLVCPFCRSAIARTDRGLNSLGKVAEIVVSQSPLRLGLRGEFGGHRFELTGRAQMRHALGGVWDEWYAVFSNGWVGWLAEAQGRFYLTFFQSLPADTRLPDFADLQLNQIVREIPSQTPMLVAEKGTAVYAAAEGEIPFKLTPGEPKNFADLNGKDNAFGTIDYSANPSRVFVGRQVTLKDIGLSDAKPNVRHEQTAAVGAMGCPNCGGSLELNAPDKTERVTCPFCNSLLDVNQGNLKFLKSLGKENLFTFELPIGAKGAFEAFAGGAEFQIIGAMVRSVTYEGTKYFWREYLLYNPLVGFRWLVEADSHWNFVEPVTVSTDDFSSPIAGDLVTRTNGAGEDSADLKDKAFHLFQTATATVEYVQGEFYWRVEQGETVNTGDYVAPPLMLSMESSDKEINWSLGTYVDRETVRKTFNAPDLPDSFVVAPNQPFKHNRLIRASLIVFAAFALITAIGSTVFNKSDNRSTGTGQKFLLSPQTSAEFKTVVFTAPFYLAKDKNTTVYIKTNLNYETWSEFTGDLLPANAAEFKNNPAQVSTTTLPSSDSTTKSQAVNVEADGEYQIRLEGNWKEWQKPLILEVDVYQYNRSTGLPLAFLTVFLLGCVPLILFIYKFNFETRRWSNTDLPKPSGELFTGIFSGK